MKAKGKSNLLLHLGVGKYRIVPTQFKFDPPTRQIRKCQIGTYRSKSDPPNLYIFIYFPESDSDPHVPICQSSKMC